MQTPKRKPPKFANLKPDPYITEEKSNVIKKQLEKLISYSQPHAKDEVHRLAEMGDFSENHAYQMAKGRLRAINQRILDLKDHLAKAQIIRSNKSSNIILGSTITVKVNGKQKILKILGSSEVDLTKGIISHNSIVGSALLSHRTGDIVKINLPSKIIEYKIVKVE